MSISYRTAFIPNHRKCKLVEGADTPQKEAIALVDKVIGLYMESLATGYPGAPPPPPAQGFGKPPEGSLSTFRVAGGARSRSPVPGPQSPAEAPTSPARPRPRCLSVPGGNRARRGLLPGPLGPLPWEGRGGAGRTAGSYDCCRLILNSGESRQVKGRPTAERTRGPSENGTGRDEIRNRKMRAVFLPTLLRLRAAVVAPAPSHAKRLSSLSFPLLRLPSPRNTHLHEGPGPGQHLSLLHTPPPAPDPESRAKGRPRTPAAPGPARLRWEPSRTRSPSLRHRGSGPGLLRSPGPSLLQAAETHQHLPPVLRRLCRRRHLPHRVSSAVRPPSRQGLAASHTPRGRPDWSCVRQTPAPSSPSPSPLPPPPVPPTLLLLPPPPPPPPPRTLRPPSPRFQPSGPTGSLCSAHTRRRGGQSFRRHRRGPGPRDNPDATSTLPSSAPSPRVGGHPPPLPGD
ncbi:WAS/WASL-interacting protein family member 1-like [Petaurus breviceps papuanus]|uniref:WAS/WASL-interacting protein family member 1-like n=1 Tax=Petaurus breviceps papuanus TaxID=3040969 RepID=UPI0036DC5546